MGILSVLASMWFGGGLLGFLLNIKNLIKFAEDFFVAGETAWKFAYYIVMFFVHVVGGLVSLGVTIYSFFHKKG